ncbi:MAG: hypothetical protein AAF633_11510 [Chloroflexota bacterium]
MIDPEKTVEQRVAKISQVSGTGTATSVNNPGSPRFSAFKMKGSDAVTARNLWLNQAVQLGK